MLHEVAEVAGPGPVSSWPWAEGSFTCVVEAVGGYSWVCILQAPGGVVRGLLQARVLVEAEKTQVCPPGPVPACGVGAAASP